MTLDLNSLSTAFRGLFQGGTDHKTYPPTSKAAGTALAEIYAGYAAHAQAGPTSPSIPAAVITALGNALGAMLEAAQTKGPDYLGQLVPAMAGAFAAFWPTVPFASVPPTTTGKVTVSPSEPLNTNLSTFLTTGNTAPRPSGDDQATTLATHLHNWTTTVLVVNTTGGVAAPAIGLT